MMSPGRRSVTAPILAGLGLLGAVVVASPPTADGALVPGAVEYVEVGAAEWIVPDNVCLVSITAAGAQGGAGSNTSPEGFGPVLPGGQGAVSTSQIDVTPGETLHVHVGGAGGDGAWTGAPDEGGAGGANGGGAAGTGGPDGGGGGGGGGGASDVRQGGDGLDNRVVVAGGGGGGGAYTDPSDPVHGVGGHAGDPGSDGGPGTDFSEPSDADDVPAGGGRGATSASGGVGGAGGHFGFEEFPGDLLALPGSDGVRGIGGDGGGVTGDEAARAGGGGGGGGLFGGGGGGAAAWMAGAGGGGGSSLGDLVTAGGEEATIGDTVSPDGHFGDGVVVIAPIGECDEEPPSTTAPDTTAPGTTVPGTTTPPAGADHDRTARPATPVTGRPTYTG